MNERISPAEVERRTEGAVERELALWRGARTEAAADTARSARETRAPGEEPVAANQLARAAH